MKDTTRHIVNKAYFDVYAKVYTQNDSERDLILDENAPVEQVDGDTLHFHPKEQYDFLGKLRGQWMEYAKRYGKEPKEICLSPIDYEAFKGLYSGTVTNEVPEIMRFRGIPLVKGEHAL